MPHAFQVKVRFQIPALKIQGEVSAYGNSASDERLDVFFIAPGLSGNP